MKLKRLFAFSLSLTMAVGMMPALAFADETDTEPSETSVVETTESKESEEPEEKKPLETKETTKEAEPALTEETKADEPSESEETKPSETKSSETEETIPSEPEETQQPEVKEDKAPDTGKAIAKTPKAATSLPEINCQISDDGILTWEPVEGCKYVSLYIRWDTGEAVSIIIGNSTGKYNLKDYIDQEVVDSESRVNAGAQTDTHYCILSALVDLNKPAVAKTEFVYKYKSAEKPVTIGNISNVRISPEGIIEWDPYDGADDYSVSIDGHTRSYTDTKCDLNNQIEFFIKNWSDFKVKDSYEITVKARTKYKNTYITIASWSGGRYPKTTNTLTVAVKTAKVKYKKLKKKKQTVLRPKVMTVSNPQGKVTYKLISVKRGKSKKYKKYFKINASTGNVTIKKKLKKGTYKITCTVSAAGDDSYKNCTKTVTFKIKVK